MDKFYPRQTLFSCLDVLIDHHQYNYFGDSRFGNRFGDAYEQLDEIKLL